MDTWVKQELVLAVASTWDLSLLGLRGLHGASAGCGAPCGAPCVNCADTARLFLNGPALEQSWFDSTSIHTHHSTLHP